MFIGRTASTITFQSDRSCVGSLLRSNTPAIQRCFRRACARESRANANVRRTFAYAHAYARDGRAVCARACAISIILRVWFPGVRYLEAIIHCKAPLGARILSAVQASASRRLLNYGNFNP